MGISSSSPKKANRSAANVVYPTGDWQQFPLPARVFHVLASQPGTFLCNSDSLAFDEYIPKLGSDELLQPGQIYFVLPNSKLDYKLSGPDMAALAVKASVALQSYNKSKRRSEKRKSRISPVVITGEAEKRAAAQPEMVSRVDRSGSLRKLQRYSSKRAKFAVRSFRLRLNTIYEGSTLVLN